MDTELAFHAVCFVIVSAEFCVAFLVARLFYGILYRKSARFRNLINRFYKHLCGEDKQ